MEMPCMNKRKFSAAGNKLRSAPTATDYEERELHCIEQLYCVSLSKHLHGAYKGLGRHIVKTISLLE